MNSVAFPTVETIDGLASTSVTVRNGQVWSIYNITIECNSSAPGIAKVYINDQLVMISYSAYLDTASGTPITGLGSGTIIKIDFEGLDQTTVTCNASMLIERQIL